MQPVFCWLAAAVLALSTFTALRPPRRPNVVLIFMDDMGYGDLGCYGATGYQTPHLDALAAEGLRLTGFLAAQPVCTASRAALLTGCYPNRIGLSGALFPGAKTGLSADETTLAELLRQQGYATGMFGKWHLGDAPAFNPTRHGFDRFVGIPYSSDMWQTDYNGRPITDTTDWRLKAFPPLRLLDGLRATDTIRTLEQQARLGHTYTREAIAFIRKNKDKPFFVYLPHSMPHVPVYATAAFRGKSRRGLYGDMMQEMDALVGEVLQELNTLRLQDNTLVIFTSDNGPWLNYGNHAGSSGGFREGKGVTYEGGNRVPCLVRWPGVVPAGAVSGGLATGLDLLPTIAEACGAGLPARKIDGLSMLALWKGQQQHSPRKDFYYYYNKNSLEAVRHENFKLVLAHPGRTYEGFLPGKDGYPGPVNGKFPFPQGLYNLDTDPGERYDLQRSFPQKVQQLLELAEAARSDLGDDLTGRPATASRPAGTLP